MCTGRSIKSVPKSIGQCDGSGTGRYLATRSRLLAESTGQQEIHIKTVQYETATSLQIDHEASLQMCYVSIESNPKPKVIFESVALFAVFGFPLRLI
jgi:hypothetical protein